MFLHVFHGSRFDVPMAAASLLLLAVISGCGQPGPAQTLRYRFTDTGPYRVETEFRDTTRMVKRHAGKAFVDRTRTVTVRNAFRLEIQTDARGGFEALFYLERIQIQDGDDRFGLEAGPEGGRLVWYGEEDRLRDYLGRGGFRQYREEWAKPFARLQLDRLGRQTGPGREAVHVNREVLAVLSRNRVVGAWILKSIKIPPVFSAVLPDRAVRPGARWTYQAPETAPAVSWEKPQATSFRLEADQEPTVRIAFDSRLDFSGEELNELSARLDLPEMEQARFEDGQFGLEGSVRFLPETGRPAQGRMETRRTYRLTTAEEEWRLSETEAYTFNLVRNP